MPIQALSPCSDLALWYDRPAHEALTEGLPLGNGRLGAVVTGGLESERIVLNESTFWSGGPYDPTNPEARGALAEVRALVFEGNYREASELAEEKLMGSPLGQAAYQPIGDLAMLMHHGDATNYRRELDLSTAVATSSYEHAGVAFERECFVSAADNVLVVRFAASRPKAINSVLKLSSEQRGIRSWQRGVELSLSSRSIGMRGRNRDDGCAKGALEFSVRVQILHDGGWVVPGEEIVRVASANSLTLICAIATSFRSWNNVGADPCARVERDLLAVAGKDFDTLKAEHTDAHSKRFGRVHVDLGACRVSTTDERIARFSDGKDPGLAALYVQYARYLLLASSAPGGRVANLQGIWNDKLHPPWNSRFTININTEMNYWPAGPGHLIECTDALLELIEALSVSGARTAQGHFGARGWVAHHNTDLWCGTAPVDGVPWGLWPTGGAWLCLHLWERFEFTGDTEFLKRAYPLIKGAAQFFQDTLVEDPKSGFLVTCPSLSPENLHPAGVSICAGPTMDSAILRELFDCLIRASSILAVDADEREQWRNSSDRLPPYRIGRQGQLQEWLDDWDADAPELHHRHVSHLFGLHPARQITPKKSPQLARAARRTLELRGDEGTGWSLAWKINFWARLLEGDKAHQLLTMLLSPERSYSNLFDAHPPFQIDGNFGGAAGILEMLVQSDADGIHLLPALPACWPKGELRGVRARGAITVDMAWSSGKLTKVSLRADQDITISLTVAEEPPQSLTLKAGLRLSIPE